MERQANNGNGVPVGEPAVIPDHMRRLYEAKATHDDRFAEYALAARVKAACVKAVAGDNKLWIGGSD